MSSLFRHASWGGGSAAIRLLFGIGNLFLAIRLVGPVAYGYLTLMLSVTVFYVAFVSSVHTISVARAADFKRAAQEASLARLFAAVWLVALLGIGLLLAGVIALGPLFIHRFVYAGHDVLVARQVSDLLMAVSAMAVVQLLVAGNVAVTEALGRFDLAARSQIFGPPMTFALLVGGFFVRGRLDIVDVAWASLGGSVLELVITSFIRIKMGYLGSLRPSLRALGIIPELLKQGVMLQGANLVNIFFDPFNKFLLNHFVGPVSVTAYELAMKIVSGIRGLFGGACRSFLQMSHKLSADGGEDYLKVLRYGMVPAMLMHGAGFVVVILLSKFWLGSQMEELVFFYLLLIPSSIGIIFAAPLYEALIGIRDLRFIFRMHVNLAGMNLLASSLLIPFLGLYGAGVGLTLTTTYNAVAEYQRYVEKIGPLNGLRAELIQLKMRFSIAVALTLIALAVGKLVIEPKVILVLETGIFMAFALFLVMEPLTSRILRSVIQWRAGRY